MADEMMCRQRGCWMRSLGLGSQMVTYKVSGPLTISSLVAITNHFRGVASGFLVTFHHRNEAENA